MVSKFTIPLAVCALSIISCASFAAYKSRDRGGDHGYRDNYWCNGEFHISFRERISTNDAAIEKVKRRVKEVIAHYDFESYEQSDVEIYDHVGQFIPVYGFAGSPPYVDATIKIKVKGRPRQNNYFQLNGDLVIFALDERDQVLERYDTNKKEWIEFWGNEFLQIGDRVRTRTGFFNTRHNSGLSLRACLKTDYNFITLTQDVEFIVQAQGLQFTKGQIAYCTQDELKRKPCSWPADFKGPASSLDYYGHK